VKRERRGREKGGDREREREKGRLPGEREEYDERMDCITRVFKFVALSLKMSNTAMEELPNSTIFCNLVCISSDWNSRENFATSVTPDSAKAIASAARPLPATTTVGNPYK
jgi:hypothetical protein